MEHISSANAERLRQKIVECGVSLVESEIVEAATECARLYLGERDDYSLIGNSRVGGVPDLPQGMVWPQSADGAYPNFLMQINLGDVPPFVGKRLPAQGMLYCFIEDDEPASDVTVQVLYYADTGSLQQAEEPPLDEMAFEDAYMGLNPYRLEIASEVELPQWTSDAESRITETLEKSLPGGWDEASRRYRELLQAMRAHQNDRPIGELQGQPSWIGHVPEPEWIEGKVLLWRISSDHNVGIQFWDAGYLHIFLTEAALERHDFSEVCAEIETS